jgi:CheY-like chemotaxis protein
MITDRIVPDKFKEKIRILVVEDNSMSQKLASIMMHTWGYRCDVCDNGKAALEKLRSKKYDMVLMDIEMPEMDGLETTRYIRNNMKLGLPVIATTAHISEEDRKDCLSAGMTDFIGKPIDEEELYNMVTNYLYSTVVENPENRAAGNK